MLGIAFAAVASTSFAQTVGVTRTEVLKSDISVPGHDAVVSRVEVAPGGKLAWHTHPGDEVAYVESGVITVLAAGKPDKKVSAGAGFVVLAGTVHGVRNDTGTPVQLITVHIVENGKPLSTPATPPVQ